MRSRKKLVGISLVEMIITIVILAIITMIAVPAYMNYLRKTRRAEATIALLDLATRMERYYAENNNSYAGASITGNLGFGNATTASGYYLLSIPALTTSSYTLQATPAAGKSQADDNECGNFTLTQTGQQGITGSGTAAECWLK